MCVFFAVSCFTAGFGRVNGAHCRLDYYYVPGCGQCRQIERCTFPQISELFGDRVSIRKHNLYDSDEYAAMLKTRAALGVKKEDDVFFIVAGRTYIGGHQDIRENLIPAIEEYLSFGPWFAPPGPAHAGRHEASPADGGHSFPYSFAALLMAGLIDGLNPCAFATIVFLISSLLAGRGRRENLLVIGLGFCSSVYLTYFLLGLGLFQIFRLSFMRLWLNNLVNWLLIAGLLLLAFLSFRDAWLFRLTGRQHDIILKLPGGLSRLIHNLIRSNLPRKHYFAGSFFLGSVVTLLESVCTGQLYLPALAFLARTSPFKTQAFLGLALYNLMFILPLIIVFFIGCRGAQYSALIAWSKKEIFWAKCVMGSFFILLALLMSLT